MDNLSSKRFPSAIRSSLPQRQREPPPRFTRNCIKRHLTAIGHHSAAALVAMQCEIIVLSFILSSSCIFQKKPQYQIMTSPSGELELTPPPTGDDQVGGGMKVGCWYITPKPCVLPMSRAFAAIVRMCLFSTLNLLKCPRLCWDNSVTSRFLARYDARSVR